ncbi:MAG: hypothetical protein JRH18_19650 [Deltaproteobacteria bacterium]|nr:hypothetical protein [Deltaproteobacteria bacterium]MBW1962653.1 hypothetical protein [Deltaproteobacteria bacterium]MBW2153868.1 hypothetical protein [Deltaproteobacteria bacterium]
MFEQIIFVFLMEMSKKVNAFAFNHEDMTAGAIAETALGLDLLFGSDYEMWHADDAVIIDRG